MEKEIKVAVYMPDEEAAKWLQFQHHYDTISILLESGALEVKNGSVILHFDAHGTLNAINRADFLYSAKHGYPHLPVDSQKV